MFTIQLTLRIFFIGSVRHSVFVLSAVAAINFFGARLRATPFLFGGKCSDV